MAIWNKIAAIIGDTLQLGLTGPKIKDVSGVVEFKNAADSAYVRVKALDPSDAQDVATKTWTESQIATSSSDVRAIRFTFDKTATTTSTNDLPANARITECRVDVTATFDGGATIKVGKNGGTTDMLQLTTDNNPAAAGTYVVVQDTSWGAGAAKVLVTVGGAPTVGGATCWVFYVTPLV